MRDRDDNGLEPIGFWEALAGSLGIGTAREGARLTRRQLTGLLVGGAILAGGLVATIVVVQNAGETTEREERDRLAQDRARARARVAAEQKPRVRRLVAPPPATVSRADRAEHRRRLVSALEAAITADARERHRRGEVNGRAARTECVPYARPKTDNPPEPPLGAAVGKYECLAVITALDPTARTEAASAGFPFWARVDFRGGRAVWCKVNPRPAEGAIGRDVFVRLAPPCDLQREHPVPRA